MGESYDVVRNSDFMVLSRASLASHESPSSGYHPGPQYTPGHQYQYTLQQAPVPGPQVHTGSRRQPSKSPHPYVTSSPIPSHPGMQSGHPNVGASESTHLHGG